MDVHLPLLTVMKLERQAKRQSCSVETLVQQLFDKKLGDFDKGAIAMTATKSRLTFEEYLTYDDGTDTRYEFDDGELVEVPPSIRLHRKIAKFLEKCFEREIERLKQNREVGRGEVGVRVKRRGRTVVRLPDVVVFEGETAQDLKGVDILESAPIIAVEIVSSGSKNRKRDYELKRQEYQELEIAEYWIIDPEKQKVTILTFDETAQFYEQQEYRGSSLIESSIYPELKLTAEQMLMSDDR